jgi:hypothetical protein
MDFISADSVKARPPAKPDSLWGVVYVEEEQEIA